MGDQVVQQKQIVEGGRKVSVRSVHHHENNNEDHQKYLATLASSFPTPLPGRNRSFGSYNGIELPKNSKRRGKGAKDEVLRFRISTWNVVAGKRSRMVITTANATILVDTLRLLQKQTTGAAVNPVGGKAEADPGEEEDGDRSRRRSG
ncbi:uncharacterized protein G2W53_034768 [Senna tora]|uniref:Uncharacterized protein n=1 Tax=Senna tora TaxID=362788 RepID=A0A834T2E2_9FABA|nr:uncharacterized protein G2W53_034768 [Senna tora]